MDESAIKFCIALVVSIGVTGIFTAIANYMKKEQNKFTKTELASYAWRSVGTVKSLWIYPVKSCRGISVPNYVARKEGPMVGYFRDRSFVIVNRQNNMVTGRTNNSLLKIVPILNHEEKSLILTYDGVESLNLNLHLIEALGEPCVVTVWDNPVPGVDCGQDAADWLETTIGAGHRLVYHRDRCSKRVIEKPECHYVMKTDGGLYADEFGYLLVSTASISDLSKRLGDEFPCQNFRPNILIENGVPYEEEEFTFMDMGGVYFRNAILCERCVFTTINYLTGERNPDGEPLRTLKKYKLGKNGIARFGINIALYNSDTEEKEVSVGDIVYVSTCPRIGE